MRNSIGSLVRFSILLSLAIELGGCSSRPSYYAIEPSDEVVVDPFRRLHRTAWRGQFTGPEGDTISVTIDLTGYGYDDETEATFTGCLTHVIPVAPGTFIRQAEFFGADVTPEPDGAFRFHSEGKFDVRIEGDRMEGRYMDNMVVFERINSAYRWGVTCQ